MLYYNCTFLQWYDAMMVNTDRLNIPVPIDIHRRAKATAALLGLPLGALATRAIENELRRLERERPRRPLPGETPHGETDSH